MIEFVSQYYLSGPPAAASNNFSKNIFLSFALLSAFSNVYINAYYNIKSYNSHEFNNQILNSWYDID